jgi:hypothetical protein
MAVLIAGQVFAALTSADGYKQLLSNIGKDPMEPSMRLVTLGSSLPSWLHALAVWVIYTILKDNVFAAIFGMSSAPVSTALRYPSYLQAEER